MKHQRLILNNKSHNLFPQQNIKHLRMVKTQSSLFQSWNATRRERLLPRHFHEKGWEESSFVTVSFSLFGCLKLFKLWGHATMNLLLLEWYHHILKKNLLQHHLKACIKTGSQRVWMKTKVHRTSKWRNIWKGRKISPEQEKNFTLI